MQTYIIIAIIGAILIALIRKILSGGESKATCPACGKPYGGKPGKCPHCGEKLCWK